MHRLIRLSAVVIAMTIAPMARAQDLATIRSGQTVHGALTETDETTNAGAAFDCFSVDATQGETVELTLTAEGAGMTPLLVAMTGCDGEVLDAASGVNGRAVLSLTRAGEFPDFVRVTTRGRPTTGAYVLVASGPAGAPPTPAPATAPATAPSAGQGAAAAYGPGERSGGAAICAQTAPEVREAALAACLRLAQDTDTGWATAGWFERGRRFEEAGRYPEAIDSFTRALALKPDATDVRFERASALAAAGRTDEALQDYRRVAELAPHNGEPFLGMARIHAGQGDLARAIADLDAAVDRAPDYADGWAQRGAYKAGSGDFAAGAADLERALELRPENGVWEALRALYQVKGGDAQGHETLARLVQLNPGSTFVLKIQVEALQDSGRTQEALAILDGAIGNAPDAELYTSRYSVRLKAKAFPGAIADADEAARLKPGESLYQNNRCWARAVAGIELDTARSACDRALQLKPGSDATLDSRGLVGLRQGRFQEAWNDYDAAVRLAPNVASYLYGRGLAALRLGRQAEGQADIVRAIGIDADVARTYAAYGLSPGAV